MTARAIGEVLRLKRTNQPVRRNSYDVEDRRAQVFRPIGDGTKHGAMRWRDKYLQLAEEYDWATKKKGERHALGANALRVLKALLWLPGLDFKTGRLEPAITTIMKQTRFARATVVAALRRLKEHGFLSWVRRTERTGAEPGEGPAVKQATNAYFFDLSRLTERARARLRQLLGGRAAIEARLRERKRNADLRAGAAAVPIDTVGSYYAPPTPGMAEALNRLGAAVARQGASSETGLNPASGDQGKRNGDA